MAFVLVLVLAFTGIGAPISRIGVTKVYADATVGSWDDLRTAVQSGGTQTITLSSDFSYDGTSIEIPSGANITITGNHTIYSIDLTSTSSPTYESMFKVQYGGKLTIDTGVTLSAKMGQSEQVCPDGKEGRPTYTFDMFSGKLNDSSNPTDYVPKGFFIHVEGGGTATLKGTVSDFITSRDKSTTPRYVAPIVADGTSATFNLDGGTIKNNLVGYIVDDNKANSDAQSIKQYVKGAGPNVPRVPNAATQKANSASFDRPRNKDAGIDDGVPGTGITATAGAIIFKGGAQGTITNGTIVNNRADTGGVMVSGEGTEVAIQSGTISKNVGVQFGGGSTVEQGGTIEMTGGKMEYNVAWFGGGAVYATENGVAWLLGFMNGPDGLSPQFDDRIGGRFHMNGGSLNNNTALTRGGAILADSDSVNVQRGALKDNMSRMLGGAVYVMGDHPKYTYTMYLTGLYVHDNVAVSGIPEARQAAANGPSSMYTLDELNDFNSKLQTKLNAPSLCGDVGADILGDVFGPPNSDDMNDGWGTHGTGGGVWLCAYGTTYFNAGATSQVVIARNYATGAVPLDHSIYPQWIRKSSDGKIIRDDIAYNTAPSVATGTGRTGGNDLHADTGSSGSVIIKNERNYPGWIDENASTSSQVQYDLAVSEGRVNIVNNGEAQTMDPENVWVEVSGNIARRGGGLAANGTFMLGMRDDQANVESSVNLRKSWNLSAEKHPVTIRVTAVQRTNTAIVADVPLDGVANAPISEYDSIEELAPTGTTWNGRFKLPIELNGTEGKIKVFNLSLKDTYWSELGYTDGEIDPTTLQGRAKLAEIIKHIKNKHKDSVTQEVDEAEALAEINSAISVSFNSNLKLSCTEYAMKYDGETGTWTIKEEGGQPVESSEYIFTSKDVNLSDATFDIQSTSSYAEEYNSETGQMEPVEVYQVHVFGINLSIDAQNDNQPLTEKYVNKDVHSDIVNFDQDFEYDIMAYVPLTAEEFTITDTLVNGLEFAGPAGNTNSNPSQVVRSIAVKTLNNHEPGESGTVSGPGEPGRNGNPINLMPGQGLTLPSGVSINASTQLNISGNTLTVHVPAGDTLDLLKGKWIQVAFGARIKDEYRSLDALKGLSANVDGKDKSWEGTDTDKKGSPTSSYLVANGDKAIVAPIIAEVGPDDVIWAVEAPSRLFARTANGDYYATPMNDKSGSTWTRLDKDLDDGDDGGYGKPVWINADNRYNGRAPHAANTRRRIALGEPLLKNLKTMPLVVGSTITKAAEGATRYFAEVEDAEGNTHIWATDKGELDSLTWHEVTDTTSGEYTNAVARLSNDRYTIRMLDLVRDTITLDPKSDTGKNWPVISDEIHEGMANQAKYSVKFGNNAEAKTYKTNTVTVAPETTKLEIKKVWDVNGKDEWPEEVSNVTFALWSVKNGTETPLKGTIGTSGTSDGVFTPSGDPNATPATYVLTPSKKSVTITGLPNLKNTTYIAREIKINNEDVTYNSDKTLGRVITADVNAFVSMEDKQKDARFQKADDAIAEELLVGAEADGRLWVMTASGKYYVTEVGDTEGTADTTTWTQVAVPNNNSAADVVALYTRAEEILGSVDAQGRQTLGTDETVTTVNLTKIFTATNTKPQTEKYVNNDVHAELVEFDKAFKYDIMVFVPMGSTELTITDPLGSALEFAKTKDSLDAANQSKAEKAATAEETIASVVYKAKNDHKADSTVSGKDEGNPGTEIVATGTEPAYTADIANNTLTIKFVGADDTVNPGKKLPLDFAGNWVQVTFWAKYTDTIIEAANVGDIEKIRNNGAVVSETYPSVADGAPADEFSHEGTKNAASAEIKVDNASTFKLDTNEVTVKPETTKISVQKKLLDIEGAEVTEWPAGLVVKINVLKNTAGSAEEPEVIHEFSITDFEKHSTGELPKLIGVTYTVSEGEITGDYAFQEMTGEGTDASPYVITNKEQKFVDVEITKKWQGATMDEIPSGVDFKTFLVLKNGAGEDVSEAFAGNLEVTANGTRYIAKWTKLPDDTYTVEEKPIPGFETVREGDVITNTKKPEEEKPEIEKYVNQAVHKEIKLEEAFTYDVIAYVTKDADSVTITDTLNDMLAFEGDASSVEVVDLGEANNHFVTNNIYAGQVNENATVSKTGEKIDAAVVEINGKTLTVSITNNLKKIDSKYLPIEIEPITSDLPPEPTYTAVEIAVVNPAEKGWYERTGDAEPYTYALTEDATVDEGKTYYEQIDAETYEPATIDVVNPAEKGWYERTGDVEPYTYTLTEDTTVDPTKTYYEKVEEIDPGTTVEQINPSELGYFEKIEEDGAEKYVLTEDTVPADGKTYYVEEALEGYEYDGDIQPVTNLRGHWIKITFRAKIDGKTLEEVKAAYKDISHTDVDENRDAENVGNAPVVSGEDHTGIPNDASYTIGVANEFGIQEDVHSDSSNVVTVKPKEYNEKPEIEKYVNQAVHKDIKIDEVFTYDIIAFVTKDADSVVIRDTLPKNLVFATDSDAVLVEDIGVENNHKVTNTISATKVNDDATVAKAGEPVTPSEVTMLYGKELIVEIPDAKAYRGHWIRVRFDVRIEAGKKVADVEADYDTVKVSEIYADPISGGERALPNVGNAPVVSEEDHTGLPNTASYEITVDNAVRYEDTSNTVTVKPKEEEPEPETVEVSVEKVWDEKYSGIDKRPTSVTINLLKNGEFADSMVLTEETGWKGTFSNLDKKDAAGNEIAYTVEEVAVEYYYYDVLWLDKTYVVTNHRRPWIPNLPSTPGNIGEVKIYKTVSGIAEKDKSYDIQVKFTYKDGSTYTHELSLKPGDEPFLFDYVPVGTKVEVSEITTGYDMTCKVDGTDATNFTVEIGKTHEVAINNDKKPEEPKPQKPDKGVPTGDSNNAREWILIFGVTALLALALAARRKA